MQIRFARNEDVPQILALLRQVGKVHHQARPDIFRDRAQKYGASQVLTMLRNPATPIFVAVEGETVLGYGFCLLQSYKNDPVMTDRTTLYIDDICVDESHRRQGVGQAVYQHILCHARTLGCHNVTLNVWTDNPGAMKFYESLGMRPQKVGMEKLL